MSAANRPRGPVPTRPQAERPHCCCRNTRYLFSAFIHYSPVVFVQPGWTAVRLCFLHHLPKLPCPIDLPKTIPVHATNMSASNTVLITAGPYQFLGVFESAAPKTVAMFRDLLPYRQKLIHVRWSGEGMWIPLGEQDFGVPFENHTAHPAVSWDAFQYIRRHYLFFEIELTIISALLKSAANCTIPSARTHTDVESNRLGIYCYIPEESLKPSSSFAMAELHLRARWDHWRQTTSWLSLKVSRTWDLWERWYYGRGHRMSCLRLQMKPSTFPRSLYPCFLALEVSSQFEFN